MNLSIGENIKTMRRKCGFTQEELAARLAVTPQAVSKWENGNGTPDISQLIPLAQIFGITTDSLLGVVSATYGNAHTEAALGHEKILMSTSQSEAEKHLAAYTYFRAESEKEPTNYVIMRKCINHGAGLSMYTDFEGFLADRPELRDEIFADCERKNLCISRYCEDRANVEKSDYAMTWIYIHTKEFDKAKKLIDRLPSLESNNLKEHIMTQYIHFQYGFEKEKEYIVENIRKLLNATAKEFVFDFEDYAWFADCDEADEFSEKLLGVLMSYKAFPHIYKEALECENMIRKYMPRVYMRRGNVNSSIAALVKIAENCREITQDKEAEEAKVYLMSEINGAIRKIEECDRAGLTESEEYKKFMSEIE